MSMHGEGPVAVDAQATPEQGLQRVQGACCELPKAEDAPGIHLVALCIPRGEREDWIGKLARAGHPVYHHTDQTLYVRDPEGNRIGLSHWPD